MWTQEKSTGDMVWSGAETGIAPSPHKGTANMQAVNIFTETGEVSVSYARALQTQFVTNANGTVNAVDSSHVGLSISGGTVASGVWITVSSSTITGLSNGTYWVLFTGSNYQLSANYTGTLVSGMGSTGTATFTLFRNMGQPIAYATEKFNNSVGTQYRYYVLDANGLVWVYDTAYYAATLFLYGTGTGWFLPDTSTTYFGSDTAPSGIAVLNGWLHVFSGNKIWVKSTSNLGGTTSTSSTWVQMTNAILMSPASSLNPHFAYVGHQGKLYYTDGTYLGSIFPDTSLLSGVANIQSYASYTASTTTGTVSQLIGGSLPTTGNNVGTTGFARIPAVFFTNQAGVQPTNLSVNTIYYIEFSTANQTFQVFAAASGGSAINIASGASGTQYFNTYFPIGTHAGAFGDTSTVTFTPQRVNLPYFEIATCMTEVGNTVIIGGISDTLYPWNQIDPTPSSIISLPERGTVNLITVNQMAYSFTGNKGNVYITDGSVASLVIKVPDYCAGIPGTQSSYIEPYFTWGGAAYIRGRVYFSILDQTSTKAGNCGGVWSFVPTQNLYIGQDTGLALRLENQNSYATYNGVATILIPQQTQNALSPQYWAGWYSSISSPTYGIDFTSTTPSTAGLIETDMLATGTILGEQKQTFSSVEYKLAAPLASGETITCKYRLNATDTYTSLGAAKVETTTDTAGYFAPLNFQKTQWVQFQVSLNPIPSTSSSFVRLTELRLRK